MNEEQRNRLTQFIEAKGLRMTSQREAILGAAFNTTEHFTAEQLLDMARKLDASVSRATVYRTLPILVESGMLKEMDFGGDSKYYDPNYAEHPSHNHIVCTDCKRIFEFSSKKIEKLENAVAEEFGFELSNQILQLRGSCQELKERGVCHKKETVH
ncbi:MAG: transcriptional repressor [Verrucomicrobiae bacterium]|nr:transcriptional repressor [Verrucomicrobiae bacterium]